MKPVLYAMAALLALSAPPVQAQYCDALPKNMAFCAAGGDWQPDRVNSTDTSIAYVQGPYYLSIAVFDLPDDFAKRQDELRQMLNGMLRNAHRKQLGEDLRFHIEDETHIDDTLANRFVFTADFGGQTRTIAESVVKRDGWFVAVTTSEPGTEFTDRHIGLHEDALGRIVLY